MTTYLSKLIKLRVAMLNTDNRESIESDLYENKLELAEELHKVHGMSVSDAKTYIVKKDNGAYGGWN